MLSHVLIAGLYAKNNYHLLFSILYLTGSIIYLTGRRKPKEKFRIWLKVSAAYV